MSKLIDNEVEKSLRIINDGGIILYPTETIWGIGCDATKTVSVEKLYNIKKRSMDKPMLSLVSSIHMVEKYTEKQNDKIISIIKNFKRPTTVIFSNVKKISPLLISKNNDSGFRITENIFCKKLINLLGKPIVSTSANISNKPFPQSFADIDDEILSQVDYVVNLPVKNWNMTPSSIVKFKKNGRILKIR
tara:strand:- start:2029 stop:2598 length:570 start_codon:yes stop_codon:yes gene_type:complete